MKRSILTFLVFCCIIAVFVYFIVDSNKKETHVQEEETSSMLVFQDFKSGSTVKFDPDVFSDCIVYSDDQCNVSGSSQFEDEEQIALEFTVASDSCPEVIESITLIYEDLQGDVELFDVLVNVDGVEYEIIDGLDILRHSVSFITYPILDGYLERKYNPDLYEDI